MLAGADGGSLDRSDVIALGQNNMLLISRGTLSDLLQYHGFKSNIPYIEKTPNLL
jgi:hypothetical protein